ncbi:MAG TPA: iron-sulfur cluster assembly accessory protein [Anaerolineales bacterium]|nr:iron-sulfur cluster assembly accessory protein [Anaerolineales bacterium]
MLQNIANLTLSNTAAEAFKSILKEKNMADSALRVYVSGSSCCSGVTFGMSIENQIYGNDITFSSNDVRMVIDDQTLEYLKGATINYINDPTRGQGFIVENALQPEGGSCSCGNDHDHSSHNHEEEGGCNCGGSCNCN